MFCETVWPKKVRTFLGKCQQWSPVLMKLQGNVSEGGLQHKCFPQAFPILEQLFCRRHASISLWSLDGFLVFNRETLLRCISEPAIQESTKGQTEKLPRKRVDRKRYFWKSCITGACNVSLSKLFPTLALKSRQSMQLDQHFVHKWSIAGGGFSDNTTESSIRTLLLIDEK